MTLFLVYLFCLAVGFIFVLGSAVLGHLFGGHGHVEGSGGHAEAGADNSDAPGISIMSPIIMAAFVTAFGAFGLAFTQFEHTKQPFISAGLAAVCALIVAGLLARMLSKVMQAADSSSEAHISRLAGVTATVITPIPAGGVGEIAYVQAGSRYTAPARMENAQAVANGRMVKISRIVGSQFYVTAVLEESK